MIDWTSRAKAYFSETGHPPTDKTDERGVLSVLSVRPQALSKNTQGVSSVSSVGVVALFGNRVLASELLTAAMRCCDHWKDGPEAREQMRLDMVGTPPHLRACLLDHFTTQYPPATKAKDAP